MQVEDLESRQLVTPGQPGELLIRGPQVSLLFTSTFVVQIFSVSCHVTILRSKFPGDAWLLQEITITITMLRS